VKVIDLADVLGSVHQLEADALAVTAGGKAPALNDRHLALHVGMLAVVGDPVDTRLRDDLAGAELLRHRTRSDAVFLKTLAVALGSRAKASRGAASRPNGQERRPQTVVYRMPGLGTFDPVLHVMRRLRAGIPLPALSFFVGWLRGGSMSRFRRGWHPAQCRDISPKSPAENRASRCGSPG